MVPKNDHSVLSKLNYFLKKKIIISADTVNDNQAKVNLKLQTTNYAGKTNEVIVGTYFISKKKNKLTGGNIASITIWAGVALLIVTLAGIYLYRRYMSTKAAWAETDGAISKNINVYFNHPPLNEIGEGGEEVNAEASVATASPEDTAREQRIAALQETPHIKRKLSMAGWKASLFFH